MPLRRPHSRAAVTRRRKTLAVRVDSVSILESDEQEGNGFGDIHVGQNDLPDFEKTLGHMDDTLLPDVSDQTQGLGILCRFHLEGGPRGPERYLRPTRKKLKCKGCRDQDVQQLRLGQLVCRRWWRYRAALWGGYVPQILRGSR